MNEAEAIRAYKEELPVEEIVPNACTMTRYRWEKPTGIQYIKTNSQLTRICLIFDTSEKSRTVYPIEKLRLCETAEGEKIIPTIPFKYETEGVNAV